jgi:valyl-tRNA synthetase
MAFISNFEPKTWEDKIYKQWEKEGIGTVDLDNDFKDLSYCILMPPPNLTGVLHAGHTLGHFVMDTLNRIYSQKDYKSLWLPGVDHAGIQLEGVIDKILKNNLEQFDILDSVKNKPDFPKDDQDLPIYLKKNYPDIWLKIAWEKVDSWRNQQEIQSKILGDRPDYSRNLFSMDEKSRDMVNFAFEKFWQEGLIYKKNYLINWSVGLQTALSDVPEDIGRETRIDPMVTFKYSYENHKLKDASMLGIVEKLLKYFRENPILVSTVRPETIFGDKAVAVHPEIFGGWLLNKAFSKDEVKKLSNLISSSDLIINFFCGDLVKNVRLILANEVDPNFGTGALKITPGHDLVDYNLFHKYLGGEFNQVIGRDGRLTDFCGDFSGLTLQKGRDMVIEYLIENNLVPLKSTRDENGNFDLEIDWSYSHNVTICERSKTIVEPLISDEFFISYTKTTSRDAKNLRELGLDGLRKITFFSQNFAKMGFDYLENIQDWCISRDLIWGHKIPIWYNVLMNPEKNFYSAADCEKNPLLLKMFQISVNKPTIPGEWVQETKILDTWFSSCLWPLSSLNYLEAIQENSFDNINSLLGLEKNVTNNPKNLDFFNFYPTNVMVTAGEIYYAWVIRMVILGVYFTGLIPFKTVVITPTVQDENGKKMSKSLGNGLDPVEAIDQYGSDSLRLVLLGNFIPNRNIKLGGRATDNLLEKQRNFGNKLWNVAKFLQSL